MDQIFNPNSFTGGTDSESDFLNFFDDEEVMDLQDQDNPLNDTFDPGGQSISSEQNNGQTIISSYGSNITFDLVQNENMPKMYRECICAHYGTSWDKILNKVMYYDGKKISMKNKILIFKLAIKKLNEREGNKKNRIKRLTRGDTRNLALLDKRLMEVFDYIREFVQSGDKDFLQLITNLKAKKKTTVK